MLTSICGDGRSLLILIPKTMNRSEAYEVQLQIGALHLVDVQNFAQILHNLGTNPA